MRGGLTRERDPRTCTADHWSNLFIYGVCNACGHVFSLPEDDTIEMRSLKSQVEAIDDGFERNAN